MSSARRICGLVRDHEKAVARLSQRIVAIAELISAGNEFHSEMTQ
jgi:hypothetical protein